MTDPGDAAPPSRRRPAVAAELADDLDDAIAASPRLESPSDIPRMRPLVRSDRDAVLADIAARGLDVREDRTGDGTAISVISPPGRPRGGVLYLHGGGFVLGDRLSGIATALDWAERLGLVVVSPEYRLAPEHPHPAAFRDACAALGWLVDRASDLDLARDRIVVAGHSAGGGLAAGVALAIRDGHAPPVAGQLLCCPMLDDRGSTPSAAQFSDGWVWDGRTNRIAWDAVLGGMPRSDVSPYAAPARATRLSGLVPAFLDVGSAEVFRDEVVAYASAIWAAGGDAELHVWPGGYHAFAARRPTVAIARAARAARVTWLRRVLRLDGSD